MAKLHILKLCVGISTVEDLAVWQQKRLKSTGRIFHRTRMMPRRQEELLCGGSLYWVMKGQILARQPILEISTVSCDDGGKRCEFLLNKDLVLVQPTPKRAFQGWRYLIDGEAPADINQGDTLLTNIPAKMRNDLAELCLI